MRREPRQVAAGARVDAADLARKRELAQERALRVRVLENLSAILPTLDTPRGLVVTVGDASFDGTQIRPEASQRTSQIASALSSQPGLNVTVEGYSDTAATAPEAAERAELIAGLLRSGGVHVVTKSLGASRPLGPNRAENRRIEIVVSGDSLGQTASWDQPYRLSLSR